MSTAIPLFQPPGEPSELRTPEGARAVAEGSTLRLESPDGALVARYDAETGTLHLQGASSVSLSAPRVELRADEVLSLEAPRIESRADAVDATWTEVVWAVGRWDLRASRIREHARDVFRDVRGLAQTRAGRVRTVARKTLQLLGARASLKAREDAVVDGKRVLLG
jgi:hypothetical protein